ncbi:MAG: leucine-rich repeat protein [Clostridiales bacterium]|nr:leucine-rich repeat protein [Clostridiales bacterium]
MRHKNLPLFLGISILIASLSFLVMTMTMKSQVLSAPGTVTGLTASSAGKNRVALKWNAVSGAQGYLVYGQKSGKYAYVGMTTQGTTFADTKALDNDYNFYWVFAYVKDGSGKMITGGCEKYVYAKGVCAAVKDLKAASGYYSVKLSWSASYGAEGYLVYGKTESGKYGYIGMTTQGTTYTDTNASISEYNYYWVFPYHKDASGKMVTGLTGKYTYGKGIAYNKSVSGLRASPKNKAVQISWDKTVPADGYIIYRKVGDGSFQYRYIVKDPGFLDTTASATQYNFYRVYPYITVKGEKVLGPSSTYVYAKPYTKYYTYKSLEIGFDDAYTMYVFGSGALPDIKRSYGSGSYELEEAPWNDELIDVRKIVIGPDITSIGKCSFRLCEELEKVDLSQAKKLKKIDESAFESCSSLSEIVIPSGTVETIEAMAFAGSGIKKAVFGEGVKRVIYNAFSSSQLEELYLPASFETNLYENNSGNLYEHFSGCTKLQKITIASGSKSFYSENGVVYQKVNGDLYLIEYPLGKTDTSFSIPNKVKGIKRHVFHKVLNLKSLYIPDSVTEIGIEAFYACNSITTITGMKNVELIDVAAFCSCFNLKSLPTLTNVKEIGQMAFYNCQALTSITFGTKLELIGTEAFAKSSVKTFTIPSSIKKILAHAFPEGAVVNTPSNVYKLGDSSYVKGKIQNVTGTRRYDYAYQVLEYVNAERAKVGAAPLTMDKDLLEAAMVRSAEIVILPSHTRPCGLGFNSSAENANGENIAGASWLMAPKELVDYWMDSYGHRANILNPDFKSIGIGYFVNNGNMNAVQVFSREEGTTVSRPANKTVTEKVVVKDY